MRPTIRTSVAEATGGSHGQQQRWLGSLVGRIGRGGRCRKCLPPSSMAQTVSQPLDTPCGVFSRGSDEETREGENEGQVKER